ncbi:MAG: galactose oxidase [Gemmatimonadaceae bacterium]
MLALLPLLAPATPAGAQLVEDLPAPVTNNAVAGGRVGDAWWIFSALGVDTSKRWSGITRGSHAWNSGTQRWTRLPDVPGPVGRLAATAQVVRGRLYLFGGYTVDSAGGEKSLPNLDIFDPVRGAWLAGAAMPVPVDDAVSGVYRDSLIYLVSGWHDTDNVQDVQLYDVVRDRWSPATPIPGPGVFGHTGEIAGNTILFIDGAAKQATGTRYALVPQVWTGTIDAANPTRIEWRRAPAHPGPPIYRAAAASCGPLVIVAGGSANPYNYNGVGYDGQPSQPRAAVMAFDTSNSSWRLLDPLPEATMDHRGLVRSDRHAWIVGGMRAGQRVSATVVPSALLPCQS